MNIILWIIQIILALWNIIGAIYMMSNYHEIASSWAFKLPSLFWIAFGALQILFAVGLVLPALIKSNKLIFISAIGIAVISLLGDILFITYSRFPGMLWGIIPAVFAAFVAYKRMAK